MVSSEKVRLTQLLREVHFFDLTRPGRLSRTAFWCALLAHLFFLAVLFIVPFETAYRLQMEPDSGFVLFWMNVFSITALAALVPLKRLAVRRLHDADFSGWWLWLLVVPCPFFCCCRARPFPIGSIVLRNLPRGKNHAERIFLIFSLAFLKRLVKSRRRVNTYLSGCLLA